MNISTSNKKEVFVQTKNTRFSLISQVFRPSSVSRRESVREEHDKSNLSTGGIQRLFAVLVRRHLESLLQKKNPPRFFDSHGVHETRMRGVGG
jgi:hypothetical protein